MKKLAMVGFAGSYDEAPYGDDTFEIWTMNSMYNFIPRYDVLFDIHDIGEIQKRVQKPDEPNHYETLKKLTKPIYMQRQFDEIPASVEFPLTELVNKYKIQPMGDKFFATCTVSHMLALAYDMGYEEVHLYGIDEAVDGEYVDEMPSVLYWLGMLAGKGVKLFISPHSPLMKGYWVYGYEDKPKKQHVDFLEHELNRVHEIEAEALRKQQAYHDEQMKCVGAAAIVEHLLKLETKI